MPIDGEEILDSFWCLSASRKFTISFEGTRVFHPLSLPEIVLASELISYDDTLFFVDIVQTLDMEFLRWTSRK